jgi:hypothetical protein
MSMDELLHIVGWGDDLFWAFTARESGSGSAVWIDEWPQFYRSTCLCRTRHVHSAVKVLAVGTDEWVTGLVQPYM